MAVVSVVLRGFRVDEAIEIPGLNSRVAACDSGRELEHGADCAEFLSAPSLVPSQMNPSNLTPTSFYDRVPNANAKRHFYARSQIYGIPKYAILKPSTQPCRYATVFIVSAAASAAACAAPASSANRLRKLR